MHHIEIYLGIGGWCLFTTNNGKRTSRVVQVENGTELLKYVSKLMDKKNLTTVEEIYRNS
jgi:hypothetical protein